MSANGKKPSYQQFMQNTVSVRPHQNASASSNPTVPPNTNSGASRSTSPAVTAHAAVGSNDPKTTDKTTSANNTNATAANTTANTVSTNHLMPAPPSHIPIHGSSSSRRGSSASSAYGDQSMPPPPPPISPRQRVSANAVIPVAAPLSRYGHNGSTNSLDADQHNHNTNASTPQSRTPRVAAAAAPTAVAPQQSSLPAVVVAASTPSPTPVATPQQQKQQQPSSPTLAAPNVEVIGPTLTKSSSSSSLRRSRSREALNPPPAASGAGGSSSSNSGIKTKSSKQALANNNDSAVSMTSMFASTASTKKASALNNNSNDSDDNDDADSNDKDITKAPDGIDWFTIYTENCTSDVARTKGINDKSLFYCICVKNPFRSSVKQRVVDERLLVSEDEVALANGGPSSPLSPSNNNNSAAQFQQNNNTNAGSASGRANGGGSGGGGGMEDFATSIRPGMTANDHIEGGGGGKGGGGAAASTMASSTGTVDGVVVEKRRPPKAFLLDEDLVCVSDSDSDDEESSRPKSNYSKRKSQILGDDEEGKKKKTSSPLFKIMNSDQKNGGNNEPLLNTAGATKEANARPVPNEFQKIIEIVWRLTQRGIDVYPIGMIQRYQSPEERARRRAGCPYEAMADDANEMDAFAATHADLKLETEDAPALPAQEEEGGGGATKGCGGESSIANKSREALEKAAAKEKKRQEEKRVKREKHIAALKKEYPNLGNFEANRFHGMMLKEQMCYLSPDKDEIFIKIHARTDQLIEFAELHSLPIISHEYSPGGGGAVACTAGLNARYSRRVEKYAKTIGMPEEMVLKYGAFNFDTPHKMRMMDRLLREPWAYGGCGLQINEMIGKEILITSFFPLHNQTSLVESGLLEWASFRPLLSLAPLEQDENAIVSYFGEQTALYFLWIKEFTFFLRWLAVPGMLAGVFSAIDFYKGVANAAFAMCCVVWGGIWCIYWTRREKEFSTVYCQEEQSAQEGVRDEFVGKEELLKISDVYELRFTHPLSMRLKKQDDGHMIITNTIDDNQRRLRIRYLISYPVIFAITLAMIAVMILITWWRFDNVDDTNINYASSVLTTVVSALFGQIFVIATAKLNDMENLRTHNDEEVQTIQKSFLFSFFSSYFSLFIIALYPLKDQSDAVRLNQLESQMVIICLVNPMIQNITEALMPNFNLSWRLESDLRHSKVKGLFAAARMFNVCCNANTEEKSELEVEKEKMRVIRVEREAREREERELEEANEDLQQQQQQEQEAAVPIGRRREWGSKTQAVANTTTTTTITMPSDQPLISANNSAHNKNRRSSVATSEGGGTRKAAIDAVRTTGGDKLLLQRYHNKVESTRERARANMTNAVKIRTRPEDLVWDDERAELWYQAQLEPLETTSGDYLEITLQFGFMAMIASSFPWAAVAALFYNLLELRLDAIKRVHFSRRPMCRTATDIGPWRGIFVIITVIAVVTNAYLVFIIGNTTNEMDFDDRNEAAKWQSFIIMQYLAVFAIVACVAVIQTDPVSAQKVKAKRAALSSRSFQRATVEATTSEEEKKKMERAMEREKRDEQKRKKWEHMKKKEHMRREKERGGGGGGAGLTVPKGSSASSPSTSTTPRKSPAVTPRGVVSGTSGVPAGQSTSPSIAAATRTTAGPARR